MPDQPAPTTLVARVVAALDGAEVGRAVPVDLATRRRALMYAEAIDDADEADALLRFGPRLRACLDTVGVRLDARLDTRLDARLDTRLDTRLDSAA